MKKTNTLKVFSAVFSLTLLMSLFVSCYSVFSGGTGGQIVDAESTSSPKQGIGYVDVYAYTSLMDREIDFNSWKEGTVFKPNASYYGHTTSEADGTFLINRLVWKSTNPAFGRDADVSQVYFLYYHENYGLTKGQTLIVSDSTSSTVYQELTAVRKTTSLNLTFKDASTGNVTGKSLYVTVSVPQTTANNTDALPKIYETEITGSGTIQVSYPRWQNDEDKSAGKETAPSVLVKYYQSAQETDWKACYNQDNAEKNYAFRDDALTGIVKTIANKEYTLTFYGKPTKLSMPVVSGQCVAAAGTNGDTSDDGKKVTMTSLGSGTEYTIDCGEVTTGSREIGTTGTEKHGVFSGLGSGVTWEDTKYKDKYAVTSVRIFVEGVQKKEMSVRSDTTSYNVSFN